MQTQMLDARRGRLWVLAGWVLFNRDRGLWAGIAVIYLALAFVLNQIPFIGYLLLLWVTPVFAGGAITVARNLDTGTTPINTFAGKNIPDKLRHILESSVSALFQIFWIPEKTLALMVIGTAALGATVIIQILAELLQVGGGQTPAIFVAGVGIAIWGPQLLSIVLVWMLQLSVILAGLYAVHLVVLDQRMSWPAIEQGVQILVRNPLPVGLFGIMFLVPMLTIRHLGAPVGLLVNALMLPIFLPSLYESYKDLHA